MSTKSKLRRRAVRRTAGQCACGRPAAPGRKQCERCAGRKAASDAAGRARVHGGRTRKLPTGHMIPDPRARSEDTITRRDCARHDDCMDAHAHAYSGHARCPAGCRWFAPPVPLSALAYTSSGTYNADAAIYAGGS